MSGQHAFLPPSGADIWVKCAAAPSMWVRYPEVESEEAREGTAAHWSFEQLLSGQPVCVGLVAPNGVVLTDEMVEGAEMYVADIEDTLANIPEDVRPVLHVEERVMIPNIHVNNWGTPDTWAYFPEAKFLYIWDYKFGHDYVDVFENMQLVDYTNGILDQLGIDGSTDEYLTVFMTIIQPRCYHRDGPVRRLAVRASELRGTFNILRAAAEAACRPNPAATVNPKCKHCSGRHACESLQREAYRAAALSRVSIPLDLPPAAAGLELTMLRQALAALKARVSGLEESVFSSLQLGERVPGWFVEYPAGRQVFNRPVPEVLALGDLMGIPLKKEATVTPKQAIKLGIPEEVINSISETPRGSPKLVTDNLTVMRKVFSK